MTPPKKPITIDKSIGQEYYSLNMVEEAKLFLTEENETLRRQLRKFFTEAGHSVVYEAGDLDTAMEGTKLAKALGVQVAILADILEPSSTTRIFEDHRLLDGSRVTTALRQQDPNIRIIAFSSDERVLYGDILVERSIDGVDKLLEAIKSF